MSTGRGRQFLAQPPQSVLHREPEDPEWRKGPEARAGCSSEVAGKRCAQRSSWANGQHHRGLSWNDRRPGLFLSRRLILFPRSCCPIVIKAPFLYLTCFSCITPPVTFTDSISSLFGKADGLRVDNRSISLLSGKTMSLYLLEGGWMNGGTRMEENKPLCAVLLWLGLLPRRN